MIPINTQKLYTSNDKAGLYSGFIVNGKNGRISPYSGESNKTWSVVPKTPATKKDFRFSVSSGSNKSTL